MKKIHIGLALALTLAGSTLAPAIASSARLTTQQVSRRFPDNAAKQAHADGMAAAEDWYNMQSPTPTQTDLEMEYEMARQNRAAAAPNSYDYWFWTGYQFRIKGYMQ